jgi:hypothetical protein
VYYVEVARDYKCYTRSNFVFYVLDLKKIILQEDEVDVYKPPVPLNHDDEVVLYRRPLLARDPPDGADSFQQPDRPNSPTVEDAERKEKVEKEGEGEGPKKEQPEEEDDDDVEDVLDEGEEETMDNEPPSEEDLELHKILAEEEQKKDTRPSRIRYSAASHQSLLRRAINSLGRFDKDMILDLFMDAPRHAVLFHFAEDDYQQD